MILGPERCSELKNERNDRRLLMDPVRRGTKSYKIYLAICLVALAYLADPDGSK